MKKLKYTIAILAGGVLLATAAFRLFAGAGRDVEGKVVLRLAHFHVHSNLIATIDEIGREFSALHPGVRVEQAVVSTRVWRAWARAQLVGGTAPDLMMLRTPLEPAMLAEYFLPLTDEVGRPNPYNADTPLAGMPWKDTFWDALKGPDTFSGVLQQVYGVSYTLNRSGYFCNLDLLEKITGSRRLPDSFDAFLGVCARAQGYPNLASPIAVSNELIMDFTNPLIGSQTQMLTRRLAPETEFQDPALTLATAAMRGDWSLRSPEIRRGLELIRHVASFTVDGATQLNREDASLMFAQGRVLFLAAGSWEYNTLLEYCDFEFAGFAYPDPAAPAGMETQRPIQDKFTAGGAIAITRGSKHPELALDFLRLLSSHARNRRLVESGNRMSSLISVKPIEQLARFAPSADGYPRGFFPLLSDEIFKDTSFLWSTQMYRLFGQQGSVERVIDAVEPGYDVGLRSDITRVLRLMVSGARDKELKAFVLTAANQDAHAARIEAAWAEMGAHKLQYDFAAAKAGPAEK